MFDSSPVREGEPSGETHLVADWEPRFAGVSGVPSRRGGRCPRPTLRGLLEAVRRGAGAPSWAPTVVTGSVCARKAWERGEGDDVAENLSLGPCGYRVPPGEGWPPAGTESCVVKGD